MEDLTQFTNELNFKTKKARPVGGIKMRFSNYDMLNENKKSTGFENTGKPCKNIWYKYTKNSLPTEELKHTFFDFINVYSKNKKIYSKFIADYKENMIEFDDDTIINSDDVNDDEIVAELDYSVKEKPSLIDEKIKGKFKRDNSEAKKVIKYYNYQCNLDKKHISFISKKGHSYMEAHHLIPFVNQENFSNSIDCAANIVCLCPNCHRKLHHGKDIEEDLLKLYNDRVKMLEKSGIIISFEELKKYYKL